MRGNNILGMIFSNMHDDAISLLTANRTGASVPFGGRYRMIDFPLSNMSNSGVNKVGVITKNNYRSLMDHLGSGKAWDLSKKRQGLILLPPYESGSGVYQNRLQALINVKEFLEHSQEEYVFLTDCDVVCNMDLREVVKNHKQTGADISIVYKKGKVGEFKNESLILQTDSTGLVKEIIVDAKSDEEKNVSLNMYVLRREYLISIIEYANAHNLKSFHKDIIQDNIKNSKIYGYQFEGYAGVVDSMEDYFNVNMDLLNCNVRADLFKPTAPVYTKVKDDMPARYGLGSSVKNSLVADGCVVEGEVENCILFRGVKVGKGTKLTNCIIMQDSDIGENCTLNYTIMDKDVTVKEGRSLMGFESYPVYIRKHSIV